MLEELEKAQESEINWSINCFYDSDFTVRIGDEMNGWKWEYTCMFLKGAIHQLILKIHELYPDSEYVKKSTYK